MKAVLKVHNNTGLPKIDKKISNNLTLQLKELEKKEGNNQDQSRIKWHRENSKEQFKASTNPGAGSLKI